MINHISRDGVEADATLQHLADTLIQIDLCCIQFIHLSVPMLSHGNRTLDVARISLRTESMLLIRFHNITAQYRD